MPLLSMKDILEDAKKKNYAVPAFNIDNMEIIQAVLQVAYEESSPVILAIGQGAIKNGNFEALTAVAKRIGNELSLPIALHLDHGSSYGQVIRCIREGFTSVMIDGSHLPLEENIRLTRKVIEAANPVGISVEAELGRIAGVEDDISLEEENAKTVDVEDVKKFLTEVDVDALAIAIGSAHGWYKGEPKLNFSLLSDINKLTEIPLVLHGGSGIPEHLIKKAISLGINKINVATEIRRAFINNITSTDHSKYDIYKYLDHARNGVKKIVRNKIILFDSRNRAY
ncbi:MAG TPA: class II fructose-bisphosphate aldolase [Atribacterota bacterium]|nr:class II fructose-bisphosphate aldolase [Atribacterota bacterium]